MFKLSKGFSNAPTMDWKKIWGDVFLQLSKSLNSINRWLLKDSTVSRSHIAPDTIIHANGLRDQDLRVFYEKNSYVDPSADAINCWSIYVANIKVDDLKTGMVASSPVNSPFSTLAITYQMRFNHTGTPSDLEETDFWEAFASVDGVRLAAGDSLNNYKYDLDEGDDAGGRGLTLCSTFTAQVLPGEHQLSLEVYFPHKSWLNNFEVMIQRIQW